MDGTYICPCPSRLAGLYPGNRSFGFFNLGARACLLACLAAAASARGRYVRQDIPAIRSCHDPGDEPRIWRRVTLPLRAVTLHRRATAPIDAPKPPRYPRVVSPMEDEMCCTGLYGQSMDKMDWLVRWTYQAGRCVGLPRKTRHPGHVGALYLHGINIPRYTRPLKLPFLFHSATGPLFGQGYASERHPAAGDGGAPVEFLLKSSYRSGLSLGGSSCSSRMVSNWTCGGTGVTFGVIEISPDASGPFCSGSPMGGGE